MSVNPLPIRGWQVYVGKPLLTKGWLTQAKDVDKTHSLLNNVKHGHQTKEGGRMRGQADRQIAETIMEQVGGQQMRTMTGAKDFTVCKHGVAFRLPGNFAKSGINRVQIVLAPNDTYTVTFNKWSREGLRKIAEYPDTYCDQLQGLFEEVTGLYVRMGNRE